MYNRARNARVPVTRDVLFPAPVKGWVQSGNITTAGRDQAEVLDNFFPTAQGARIRGGATEYADIGESIVRLMVFSGTSDALFASTETGIFDADRVALGGEAFADVTGLTSGDWSCVQFSTAGGDYLVMVNGADPMHYHTDAFYPVTGENPNYVAYDGLVTAFEVGETVTGGTSGATATIIGITQTAADAGILRLGAITGGPFQDDEDLTSAAGEAVADGASGASTAISVTGVSTSNLAQVFSHKSRLFFVEKNTLKVWYLPAVSIGGAASEIDLGAIFRKGGTLTFGASWSLDSGSGLDDVAVFVTSNGEVAIYEGSDPSDAADWRLAGVYEISRPLNKHSFFRAGGDLAILTEDGIVPVSEALRKDRAALQAMAITYPIEDAWKNAVAGRSTAYPITPTLWQSQALLLIGVSSNLSYVANARTGAWCRYTGWDVRCGAVANDRLYFGSNDGKVMRGQYGGTDDGVSYTARFVPKFTDAGTPQVKVANAAAVTVKATKKPDVAVACFSNYTLGDFPIGPVLEADPSMTWGEGVWGEFVWGGGADVAYTFWKSAYATGYSIAPVLVVTVNQDATPSFEILAARLRFEIANPL